MKKSSHYLDFGGPISLVDVDKLFFISNYVFNNIIVYLVYLSNLLY
jgi:hypothetical protein